MFTQQRILKMQGSQVENVKACSKTIQVMKKMYIPECNQDFSTNIMRNATFKMDLGRCTETTYMTNGSRILTAHIEIGFHPLVITSSDRVYSVQCIDNSYATVRQRIPTNSSTCSHVVRSASKFEGITVFHVGDSVVHEWNCVLDPQEHGTVQVFLTSCNAISQAGQVIHLVDENGCVIDSELMGDLIYNNYTPKIYARAKIFKLMNGEKYRIECSLQMCKKDGSCMNRPYPPKCAFSKEEILNRYQNRVKHSSEDVLMTGGINNRFERQVKVTSEWVTVHHNQYTNVDQLRYFINAVLDPSVVEDTATTLAIPHFLMGISYRDPTKKFQTEKERTNDVADVTNPVMAAPSSFKPQNNPVISSSEENQIETISEDLAAIMPIAQVSKFGAATAAVSATIRSTTTQTIEPFNSAKFARQQGSSASSTPQTSTKQNLPTTRRATTIRPFVRFTTVSPQLPSAIATVDLTVKKMGTSTSTTPFPLNRKTPLKGNVATMRFYTDTPPTTRPPLTTTKIGSTTEMPFKHDSEIFTKMVASDATAAPSKTGKENFANPRDWRLDDRTINDTDIFSSDKQTACSTNSTVLPPKRCIWSGLDHLLIVWSFGSALVWIVMLAVCFYRNSRKKPDWIAYREREMKRLNRARVLPQEHPWLHADAFEEPKLRKKHEIDMSKF